MHQQMRQLIAEDLRGFRRREVSLLVPPPMDGAHHAADQLLDAPLPLRRPDDPTEVLRDDDVGGDLRPGGRDLHVVLREHDLTLFVGDGRRAGLLSGAFWLTFPEFARYRRKRLWPVLLALPGGILVIWGLVLLFQWLLAYYADRLGHPLT